MSSEVEIQEILSRSVERKASDIHLKLGSPPIYRVNRELTIDAEYPTLDADDMERYLNNITTERQREIFNRQMELDFAFNADNIGRFRVNVYRQLGTISLVFRYVNEIIPPMDQLGLPEVCKSLISNRDGLIILTGPTGCGKSTTIAAMLHYLNTQFKRNVITIEDPIEFMHHDEKCVFSQREVGMDTQSFSSALKYILRQDPDVILIGEMRDLETMSIALTAAETGHLVLTSLHTPSSYEAVDRIIDAFPSNQHQQIRLQLSTVLQAILYQSLIPRKDGEGLALATEILIATPAIRNLIREAKTHQMPTFMHSGQNTGMQTLDQSLVDLYHRGIINYEEAKSRMQEPENLNEYD
jgi:twitching motility protein PilT